MTATALITRHKDVLAGPIGSFDAYMDKVSRIPVLTREDESELAKRFRNEGDLDAARQLVLSHLRFVVHIARGYSGYGLPLGDVVQEANVGLMKAVKRFDPSVGVRLVSFAVTGFVPRSTSMCCATGGWSRSPPPRRSASCSSICAR